MWEGAKGREKSGWGEGEGCWIGQGMARWVVGRCHEVAGRLHEHVVGGINCSCHERAASGLFMCGGVQCKVTRDAQAAASGPYPGTMAAAASTNTPHMWALLQLLSMLLLLELLLLLPHQGRSPLLLLLLHCFHLCCCCSC